jgi:serine/threonine-protein kinase RsbW
MSTDNIELHLPSILGYEKIARRVAEAVAEQMDFAPDRIEDLKTAVAEACMNAIEHGNNQDRAIQVSVQMLIMPDKLEVRVSDMGLQAMPDALPEPGSGDMRGWGMYFIQNLVDEMEITRLPDGGNEVRMTLYLARTSAAETSAAGDKTPGAIQAVEPKPSAIQPAEVKPSAVQPAEAKPSAIQPAEVKPSAVQPAEAKPSAIQPAQDKPSAIQPAPLPES